MRKKWKLTEGEWGQEISKDDRALVDTAWEGDKVRYTATEKDVFNATVPFGSTARKGDTNGRA